MVRTGLSTEYNTPGSGVIPAAWGAIRSRFVRRKRDGGVDVDTKQRVSVRAATVVAVIDGLLVGFAVALWRVPMSGVDTQPPECFAQFGNTMPCGSGPTAFGFAAVAAVVVGTLTYLVLRRIPLRRA